MTAQSHEPHRATFLVSGPDSDYSDAVEAPEKGQRTVSVEEALEGGRADWERFRRVARAALKEHPDKVGEMVVASFKENFSA